MVDFRLGSGGDLTKGGLNVYKEDESFFFFWRCKCSILTFGDQNALATKEWGPLQLFFQQ